MRENPPSRAVSSETSLDTGSFTLAPSACATRPGRSLSRVVGVKDATGDLARPMLEQLHIKRPFCYFSGDDATAVAYNVADGTGCISVTANVAPYLSAAMQLACLHGIYRDAIAIQRKLMPLHQPLFAEPSPAGVKYAVSLLGHCEPECRLPIVSLSDATKVTIRSAMSQLKLI
jgi:4-hydroxy-tetrahydrodipicolinate synthase